MMLDKIVLMVDQPESVLTKYISHIKDEKEIGKSEGFDVFEGSIENMIAYVARTLDGDFIGYAIGGKIQLANKIFFQPKYTYFLSKYRNKGYATALYQFIFKKVNIPIVSDKEQTKYGKALWAAFDKKSRCKVYDTKTDTVLNKDDVPPNELYSTDDELGKRYLLMLAESSKLHGGGNPSQLFHENLNYTHEENRGKYL